MLKMIMYLALSPHEFSFLAISHLLLLKVTFVASRYTFCPLTQRQKCWTPHWIPTRPHSHDMSFQCLQRKHNLELILPRKEAHIFKCSVVITKSPLFSEFSGHAPLCVRPHKHSFFRLINKVIWPNFTIPLENSSCGNSVMPHIMWRIRIEREGGKRERRGESRGGEERRGNRYRQKETYRHTHKLVWTVVFQK